MPEPSDQKGYGSFRDTARLAGPLEQRHGPQQPVWDLQNSDLAGRRPNANRTASGDWSSIQRSLEQFKLFKTLCSGKDGFARRAW